MEELKDVIDQVLAEGPPTAVSEMEEMLRRHLLGELFKLFGATSKASDLELLKSYLQQTERIPVEFLAISLTAIIRSHQWPSLPKPAQIWNAARLAAGMDRWRYEAGHYLPPATDWPPLGNRYGVVLGELEPLNPKAGELLASGLSPALLAGTTSKGEHDAGSDTDQERSPGDRDHRGAPG